MEFEKAIEEEKMGKKMTYVGLVKGQCSEKIKGVCTTADEYDHVRCYYHDQEHHYACKQCEAKRFEDGEWESDPEMSPDV